MGNDRLNRRDFLTVGTGAAAAGLLGDRAGAKEGDPPATSRVVLIRDRKVLDWDGQVDSRVLHRMLNEGVAELLGEKDSVAAWRRLITPSDVVGIKSNVWSHLPTPPALEVAIQTEVERVGVSPNNVAVDDRGVLENPVFKRATAIINTRPLRTHHWSGLGTSIKNLIMFVPRPQAYHGDACAPLGSIWLLPELKGKVRLNVLVMLTPQFHGIGAHSFSREFIWPYGGLIIGVDPVAVDATGARIIEAKRKLYFGDGRPISPPPHHIQVADTQYGLGVSDPARIDVVRLGWQEEALI
jgi:hypothetical protein